jgi:hypothetical protein
MADEADLAEIYVQPGESHLTTKSAFCERCLALVWQLHSSRSQAALAPFAIPCCPTVPKKSPEARMSRMRGGTLISRSANWHNGSMGLEFRAEA